MSSWRTFVGTQCDGVQIKLTVLCDFLNRQGQDEVLKVVPPVREIGLCPTKGPTSLTIPDHH